MMHSFSLTRDYVIIYDLPVTFDARAAAEINTARPLRPLAELALSSLVGRVRLPPRVLNRLPPFRAGQFPYRWNPEYPARIGLLRRDCAEARTWIELDEPCYVFHPMNAWNDGTTVVAEVVVHERVFDTDPTGPSEGKPRLERWTMKFGGSAMTREQLIEQHIEFPRVDERFVADRHRVGWAVSGTDDLVGEHVLVRIAGDGTVLERDFGTDSAIGEFVFVPESSDAPEAEGVLLGFVTNIAVNTSALRILDATTLEDVAAVQIPARIPAGFHGNWIGSAS